MAGSRDAAFDTLLRAARAEYAQSLPAKAADLRGLVARSAWDDVRRAVHKLRGSAGVYGFEALSAAAARLEDRLLQHAANPSGQVSAGGLEASVGELLAELERACEEAP